MQTRTDAELLRDYAVNRSEAAFGEIVRRYADVVYSAALRLTGNSEPARDVAQTVFADLARKAGSLPANTLLIGWLHRGARLAALEQLRKDQRRQQRERQAMDSFDSSPETPGDWTNVRPVLDEAIASLGHEDRDALLLRFFKDESLSSVGAALGVSEDAAQKRVSRALDKLREFLAGRGIKTSTAALSAALLANAVQSAPAGFVASLSAGALAQTAAAPAAQFFTAKAALTLLALAGAFIGAGLVHLHSQQQLHEARAQLQQTSETTEALRTENEQIARLTNEVNRLRSETRDLPRLRGETARLRRDLAEAKQVVSALVNAVNTNRPTEPPPEPQLNFKAKFVTVPAEYGSGDTEIRLTELQADQMMKSLAGGFKAMESSVITLSGRQAQIQMSPFGDRSESDPAPGANENTMSLALDLLGTCQTNPPQIILELAALTLLESNPSAGPNKTPGYRDARTLFAITNLLQVPDGQTLFISRKLPTDWLRSKGHPGPDESLLIFLTSTLIDPAGNRLVRSDATMPDAFVTNSSLPFVIQANPGENPFVIRVPRPVDLSNPPTQE